MTFCWIIEPFNLCLTNHVDLWLSTIMTKAWFLDQSPVLPSFQQLLQLLHQSKISTGERPFIDILQDRRYWVIHLITIASIYLGGVISMNTGFVYKLFGVANFNQYFYNDNTQISLINDRFSILNEIEDIWNVVQ